MMSVDMKKNHSLNITWSKAYGEPYCHHASITIPRDEIQLFGPELVYVGVTVRNNVIVKREVTNCYDKRIDCFLPCEMMDGAIEVRLNSSQIVEALCLNSWTTLKNKVRGTQKEFPINIFYKLEDADEVVLPFDYEHAGTPYMVMEPKLAAMADGDRIESTITFNINPVLKINADNGKS